MQRKINNDIYHELGERWYHAYDDPVALLRSESRVKAPWVLARVQKMPSEVLDIGCGGGFLSNAFSEAGHQVTGIDLSNESLHVAKKYDKTGKVKYLKADAYVLPFLDATFDVVTAMDFLEHVEEPARVIAEISRVLRPGGRFFFHTFNRNRLSKWVIIRAVEIFVKNTPRDLHLHRLFITPAEIEGYCSSVGLRISEWSGIRPKFSTITVASILKRTVPETFEFTLTESLKLSYLGCAQK